MLKRKREKCSKGLRHFSMKVCEKVKQKGITTYNQVADELVNEYCNYSGANNKSSSNLSASTNNIDFWTYDQKNVRRRVYDALNVLMAMNIISKEKKEIKWIGLPCNKKQECQDLEAEKARKEERIKEKSEILKNLLIEVTLALIKILVANRLISVSFQHIATKSLMERNQNRPSLENEADKIKLPFILLKTDSKTIVDTTISSDR